MSVGAQASATAPAGVDRSAQAGALASWFGIYEIGAAGTDVDLGFAITNGAATDGLFLGDGVTGATDLAISISAINAADLGDLSTPAQLDALNAFLGGNLFSGTARLDNPPATAGGPALSTSGDLDAAGLTESTVCAGGTGTCVDFALALDFNDFLVGNVGDSLLLNVSIAATSQVDASAGSGGTASTDLLDTLTVSVTSTNGVVTLQSVPEPGTVALLALGLAGLGARRRGRTGAA